MCGEIFQQATGFDFWLLELTLLVMSRAEESLSPVVNTSTSWPISSVKNAESSFSLSYTKRVPSMCEARKRFSDPGIHLTKETGVLLIEPFLLIRAYFCDIGSYQIISPAEEPIITSRCVPLLVNGFTSWHNICAFVKRILARGSDFAAEDRSSH